MDRVIPTLSELWSAAGKTGLAYRVGITSTTATWCLRYKKEASSISESLPEYAFPSTSSCLKPRVVNTRDEGFLTLVQWCLRRDNTFSETLETVKVNGIITTELCWMRLEVVVRCLKHRGHRSGPGHTVRRSPQNFSFIRAPTLNPSYRLTIISSVVLNNTGGTAQARLGLEAF